jgi:4-hydroxybenzoate polyprenyltransferase
MIVSPEEQLISLPARWRQFIKERFSLVSHLPTVFFFVLGNSVVFAKLQEEVIHGPRLAGAILLTLLFFFRLRCFDEVKDYHTDLSVNPTRPLARGLLQVSQVKLMIYGLTIVELALAALFGKAILATNVVAIAYSYLMYREFFIGSWLSRHLTTYAVTHTFVSVLIGCSIASQVNGLWLGDFDKHTLQFSLVNWMMFNLYEFARKTYAPDEERFGVDTYSSLFFPAGAALLSLSQVVGALTILWILPQDILQSGFPALSGYISHIVLALLLPGVAAVFYIIHPSTRNSKNFRNITGIYLLAFYGLLALQALT